MNLEESRLIIDECDRNIVSALQKRFEAAREIAAYKKEHGLPIRDAAREAVLLEKIARLAGDKSGYVCEIYQSILNQSRAYQARLNHETDHEN